MFTSFVRLRTSLDLHGLKSAVSEQLFGGAAFVDSDDFDEGDGVKLTKPILGLSATISGYGGIYMLRVMTVLPVGTITQDVDCEHRSLDDYLYQCLSGLPLVEVVR